MNEDLSINILKNLPAVDHNAVDALLEDALCQFHRKMIVLDDDPTGVQTVHDVSVFTDWSTESIEQGFREAQPMFFILTNSRSMTVAETEKVHREIAKHIVTVASRLNREFIIISRGDSTLRGHYPLETKVLKETIESESGTKLNGEVILPFFQEGGRLTLNNTHYVLSGEGLVPAAETEFAKDRTFGYSSSHLGEWIEEKSNGEHSAKDTLYVSLEQLRSMQIDQITEQLLGVTDFRKVVVNAVDEIDVKIFTIALVHAMNSGGNYLFRTAAAFPKVIGGVSDRALLAREELVTEKTGHGGLIIVGSHVKKTTEQLQELKKLGDIAFIAFDSHLVLKPDEFRKECDRVQEEAEIFIRAGKTVAVYTRRERLDLGEGKKEEELKLSTAISDALTGIVTKLKIRPNFIVAKGGITSSDIGTKGLKVIRATVEGQIRPGIPVWRTGSESKYPGMPYVIFPGNVGAQTDLKVVAEILLGT